MSNTNTNNHEPITVLTPVPSATQQIAPRELTPDAVQLALTLAPIMHQCRYYGVSSPEQAAAIMLVGYSYGFDFVTAFRAIYVIDGKPSLAPAAAWGLVLHSGLLEDYEIEDQIDAQGKPWACRVMLKRWGLRPYSVIFTLDDARGAGLTEGAAKADGSKRGRGNWEKYPANMLRWRAIGYACDALFPDLMAGFKRADEFGAAVDGDGNVLNQEAEP